MRARFIAAVLGLLALLGAPTAGHAQSPLKIFACVPEWESLARELGGDKVSVGKAAAGALQDPDKVEITPALLGQVREAALVVCTGPLEAEWLPTLLRRAGNAKVRPGTPGYFSAASFVRLLKEDDDHGKGHDDDHKDGEKAHAHSEGHPHIQTDPRNIRAVALQLGRRLGQIDKANASYYAERTKAFVGRLDAAIKRWQAQAAPLKGMHVIAQHDNLNYLFVWLGIEQVANVELVPAVAPGPAHLAKVIDMVPGEKVRFVVNAAYEDPKSVAYVAERAKVPFVTLAFTVGGNESSKDLISLFDDMIGSMLKAAGRSG